MESRPKATRFEDLVVWQKAHQLVLHTYRQTSSFPDTERYGLVSQMRRSAVSVPANIAEAFGRIAAGDKVRFLGFSQGSLQELRYSYLLSNDLNYTDDHDAAPVCEEVSKILSSYIRQVRQNQNKT